MARFFDAKYVYSDWEKRYYEDDRVYVYLERDCQEFIFQVDKQILEKYHKREIDLDTFVRFEREAESGDLRFRISENGNQLMIL